MSEPLELDADARLHRVAIGLVLPAGLHVEDAVVVAEDLVAAGFDGEATVEVAALSRGSSRSDAETLVRAMLAEHGIDIPVIEDEDSAYRALLRAVGYWDLPIHVMEGCFYARVLAWDEQGPLDRELVVLLDEREHLTDPLERHAFDQEIRAVVRAHVPAP